MEGVVTLLVLFFVMSVMSSIASQKKGKRSARRRPPTDGGGSGQPTSIRDLLEEFRRSMEEAERKARGEDVTVLQPPTPVATPRTRPRDPAKRLPSAAAEPAPVDFDNQAEAIIRERRRWAEEHARALTDADHDAFDERIRASERKAKAKPAPAAAVTPDPRKDLRRMMIWREVLGPPVAYRNEGE